MKIVIAATPVIGHLNPMLSIGRHLLDRGHEVCVLTGASFSAAVLNAGLAFKALPEDIDMADLEARFPARAEIPAGPQRVAFDIENIFVKPVTKQAATLTALAADWQADLVFADNFFLGVAPLLLGDRLARPPIIVVGVTPLLLPRDDHAPFGAGLPFTEDPATQAHYRDVIAPAAAAMFEPAEAAFSRQLADLGRMASPFSMLETPTFLADIHLQFGPPGFELPRAHLSSHIRFLGLPPLPPSTTPLPVWAADVDRFSSVVMVTQGTVANDDLRRLAGPTIKALGDRPDTLVIVTGGGRDPQGLGHLPANVRTSAFLPLDWIMPKLSALVTNGGFGTVLQALASGVPIVAAGETEDKPEVACRIARSGAGIDLRTESPTVAELRTAVTAVLTQDTYRRGARRLQEEFAAFEPGEVIGAAIKEATAWADWPSRFSA